MSATVLLRWRMMSAVKTRVISKKSRYSRVNTFCPRHKLTKTGWTTWETIPIGTVGDPALLVHRWQSSGSSPKAAAHDSKVVTFDEIFGRPRRKPLRQARLQAFSHAAVCDRFRRFGIERDRGTSSFPFQLRCDQMASIGPPPRLAPQQQTTLIGRSRTAATH